MPPIFDRLFKRSPTAQTTHLPAASGTSAQFEAVFSQGTSAAAARNLQGAIEFFEQAIGLDPSRPEPYYKRANALKDLGLFDPAIGSYNQAIERKADYSYAYCNRGFVEHHLGRLEAASASYDAAIAIDPSDAFTHYNRALLLQDRGRWEESLASYDRAIAINPDFAQAQFNRALNLLYLGRFESGWPAFEWRWKNAQQLGIGEVRNFEQPLWLGEASLAGKRLLIHSEQGLGDTIQFCRYAMQCSALGAAVIMEVQAPLVGLLAGLQGVSQVIARGSPLPAFDHHCPIMSLPLAFKTTISSIPAPARYLFSDEGRSAQWRATLGERQGPRIGLTWSGNQKNLIGLRRSIRLADWIPYLPPQFQYFQLQTEVRETDRQTLESTDFISSLDLQDFADTAAVCESMDLIITIDTSVAHLSGAMGKRAWLLLPYAPDWRWMRERGDTPWYPSIKLYRQRSVGDWNEVFARVAADLHREFP